MSFTLEIAHRCAPFTSTDVVLFCVSVAVIAAGAFMLGRGSVRR